MRIHVQCPSEFMGVSCWFPPKGNYPFYKVLHSFKLIDESFVSGDSLPHFYPLPLWPLFIAAKLTIRGISSHSITQRCTSRGCWITIKSRKFALHKLKPEYLQVSSHISLQHLNDNYFTPSMVFIQVVYFIGRFVAYSEMLMFGFMGTLIFVWRDRHYFKGTQLSVNQIHSRTGESCWMF